MKPSPFHQRRGSRSSAVLGRAGDEPKGEGWLIPRQPPRPEGLRKHRWKNLTPGCGLGRISGRTRVGKERGFSGSRQENRTPRGRATAAGVRPRGWRGGLHLKELSQPKWFYKRAMWWEENWPDQPLTVLPRDRVNPAEKAQLPGSGGTCLISLTCPFSLNPYRYFFCHAGEIPAELCPIPVSAGKAG